MNRELLLTAFLAALDAQRAVIVEMLSAATSPVADLTGRRFGELTVVGRAPSRLRRNGKARTYWACRCSCGAAIDVRADHLRGAKSCGHLSRAAQFKRSEHRAPEQGAAERRAKRRDARAAQAGAQAQEFAERLRPLIVQAIDDGCSLQRIAGRLNAAGTRARFGGAWTANAVYGVLLRLGLKTRRAKAEPGAAPAIEPAPIEHGEAPAPVAVAPVAPANAADTIEQGATPAYWSEP